MSAVQSVFEAPGALLQPFFVIASEEAGDASAREALLDRAMGPGRRRKSSEKLRAGRVPAEGLAFVARDDAGRLAGTVRLWNIAAGMDCLGRPVPSLLLGPLAVEPCREGQGVGSALMQHAIAEATRLGHGAVLLVGDPEYYGRFGFSAAFTTDLAMPGPVERRRFLALELKAGWLAGAAGVLCPTGRRAVLRRPASRRAATS